MRIITDYKDYYDHVAFMYGGGDPKIVYVRPHRHKFIPSICLRDHRDGGVSIQDKQCKCKTLLNIHSLWNSKNGWKRTKHEWERVGADVMGIVIGDIIFTKIKYEGANNYRFVNDNDVRNIYWKSEFKAEQFINFKDDALIDVCRATKMPVFSFSVAMNDFHIHELMPNLGALGIPPFIPANEMYQHLSYFIGNTMNESPDMMKPIVVSDRVKIEGHGFDYKTSFRGMK